jgi:hypothetical protein
MPRVPDQRQVSVFIVCPSPVTIGIQVRCEGDQFRAARPAGTPYVDATFRPGRRDLDVVGVRRHDQERVQSSGSTGNGSFMACTPISGRSTPGSAQG